ncbi:MAG: RpiB/LacA/LacB family sugar-phosphate isomerase [Paludibacteraceae bacterium]|nr:RpiB/LacA/LacB family sugar-phosphate isomerase [Candidatus Physcocola equi]MCQ2234896.1 RpiB/LacA/LacB family sugar-phosphate isomerase [Paludibacteraceae bacterium]
MKDLKEMVIGIANDHAGTELKFYLMEKLKPVFKEIKNFGTDTNDSCDYPDFAHPLGEAIENGTCELGIAICGSANGISMTLNKHQGVRAALSWRPEIAMLGRAHNNANVVSLPARFLSKEEALMIVETFFKTDFEGGRHEKRVAKIAVK